MNNYQLTILIPVFNEQDNLQRVAQTFQQFLTNSSLAIQVLFINDGSTDDSQAIIQQICQQHPHFHYLELTHNNGLSTALKVGIDHCTTPFLGYLDADLQTTPEDFELLIPHIYKYQLVTGIRANRQDTILKKTSSRLANAFRQWLLQDGSMDTGCPLKIMTTKTAQQLPFFKGMHRFLPALVQLQGGTVKQIPVRHFPRIAGTSKYHFFNRSIRPLLDTIGVFWLQKRNIQYHIKKTVQT